MRYSIRKLKQGEDIPTRKPHHRRIAKGGEWAIIDIGLDKIVVLADELPEVYELKSAALSQMRWMNTL